jgi:hypothetical protein
VTNLHALNQTLDQELLAVLRGASLECLLCGEFLLHAGGAVRCPECGMALTGEAAKPSLQLDLQAG